MNLLASLILLGLTTLTAGFIWGYSYEFWNSIKRIKAAREEGFKRGFSEGKSKTLERMMGYGEN